MLYSNDMSQLTAWSRVSELLQAKCKLGSVPYYLMGPGGSELYIASFKALMPNARGASLLAAWWI